jgi:hypothetical protein
MMQGGLKTALILKNYLGQQHYQIVISEGSKPYLTKQVGEDNKHQFFKPYKDLCAVVGDYFIPE